MSSANKVLAKLPKSSKVNASGFIGKIKQILFCKTTSGKRVVVIIGKKRCGHLGRGRLLGWGGLGCSSTNSASLVVVVVAKH
jgi:hypothetical protein